MAMRRFRVAEDSMRPTLQPSDEIVATDSLAPAVGDIVIFPHPDRHDFWMVKRMVVPPQPIGNDHAWVVSDNPEVTRADSRTLGPVPNADLMTMVKHLDATTFVEACELFAGEDETLAGVIDRHGVPDFWHRAPGLQTLVLLILEQQVSLESGAAMYRRLEEATGGVTSLSISGLGIEGLRSIGVTRQKADYLISLAEGTFDVDTIADFPLHEARDALLSLRGVGPWTADAYLLSALRHPDIFPLGDRALQVGVGEVLGMRRAPDEDELELLSEPWRPIRAAAARLIWHAYLSARGRVEPPDPTLARTSSGDA